MTDICHHKSIRAANGGVCVLCDQQTLVAAAIEELTALELAARDELAKLDAAVALQSLYEFVLQAWEVLEPMPLDPNWHIKAICDNVQGMFEEWLKRRDDPTYVMRWQKLLLNICPSTLKSRIIMVFAVAWMWLRCPTWSVLCVSANPANVTRDAEACRDLITSPWYVNTFGVTWRIRDDIDAKAKFVTTAGGKRISRGLIAKFTGIHVDAILVDDPDDAHDVHSEAARRERAGKIEAISSRLNDKRHFVMIVGQQRVHVDDATGDALSRGGWLQASYPLEYHADWRRDTPFYTDPRTIEGENLHPIRFTDEVIALTKLELGSAGFEAQYNQNPAPREGGMFKRGWFRYFRIDGQPMNPAWKRTIGANADPTKVLEHKANGTLDLDWMSITVDATFGSLKATASRVGLLAVGGKGPDRFLFADRTKSMTYTETKAAIAALMLEFPATTRILIENKANGAALIDELGAAFSGLIGLETDGGKESRAAAMSPAVESGCVYLLEGALYIDEFLAELCVFPHGKHDDRVDALSQLMNYFRESTDAMKLAAKNAAFAKMGNSLFMRRL